MKAVQATRFGDPTVLAPADLPDPVPGPGQIAIDVTHAAVGLPFSAAVTAHERMESRSLNGRIVLAPDSLAG